MALREEPTRFDPGQLGSSPRRRKRPPATPFDDQEVFDRFVESLRHKIQKKLENCLDHQVQREIGRLLWLLNSMPRAHVYQNRAFFEMAFDLLAAEHPNLLVTEHLRAELANASIRSTRLGRLLVGEAPIQTIVMGLLSTFLLLFLAVALLDLCQAYLRQLAVGAVPMHPIAELIQRMPMAQIIALVVSAFIGAVVSVLARLRLMLELARTAPLLVYVTVATKPFVSIAFALFIYAVIGSGVVTLPGISLDHPQVGYLVWTIGFMSGFSERFVRDFVNETDRIVAPADASNSSGRSDPSP